MDCRWDAVVRPQLAELVRLMCPSHFLPSLHAKRLIRFDEYESLCQLDEGEQTSRLLISILPRKGLGSYDTFVDILRHTEGQEHLAQLFDHEQREDRAGER